MASSVIIEPRQSLADIALQVYGQLEAIFDIAMINNMAITDDILAGNALVVHSTVPNRTATMYHVYNIKPATAITDADYANTIAGEGIEFWAIETEFLIS